MNILKGWLVFAHVFFVKNKFTISYKLLNYSEYL